MISHQRRALNQVTKQRRRRPRPSGLQRRSKDDAKGMKDAPTEGASLEY